MWGSNGDLDFLMSIDGRSYRLQCRSACRTQQAEKCIGLSRPRIARTVAHARKRVQRRRPRVLNMFSWQVAIEPRREAFTALPAYAERVARAILEACASSDEQCVVVTSPVPRRFRTIHHHSCVSLARGVRNRARFPLGRSRSNTQSSRHLRCRRRHCGRKAR